MIECCPPRRMRFSFESRCRIVALIVAGMSPQAAAAACGAQPCDRLPAAGALPGGRLGGACTIALRCRGGSRGGSPPELEQRDPALARELREGGPAGDRRPSSAVPASTVGKVLRRAGVLAAAAAGARPGRPLRARAAGRAAARRHRRSSAASGRSASGSSGDGVNRTRRAGWQYLHVAIDDHSRLAYCELLPSERTARLRRLPRAAPSPGTASTGSPSSACSATTRRLPLARLARRLRRARRSTAATPAPTAHRPTAKPKR